tara:strand:+ start:918 stop:1280 length:363 start_codon:yes stop_codon:yes gene_type:complete
MKPEFHKKKKYNLFLFYKDTYVCCMYVKGDEWEKVYNEVSRVVVQNSFKVNVNYKSIINTCTNFCDKIEKMKRHCEKIKDKDFMLFLSCYFILVKFNKIDHHDFLFIKNKKIKKRVNIKI